MEKEKYIREELTYKDRKIVTNENIDWEINIWNNITITNKEKQQLQYYIERDMINELHFYEVIEQIVINHCSYLEGEILNEYDLEHINDNLLKVDYIDTYRIFKIKLTKQKIEYLESKTFIGEEVNIQEIVDLTGYNNIVNKWCLLGEYLYYEC